MPDELVSWVDPAGTVTLLNDGSVLDVGWGLQGRFMPPVEFVEDDVPNQDGNQLREVRVRPREVALPLDVQGADAADLRIQLRSLLRMFNPKRGNGRLRVTSPDGTVRELTCRYRQGLELQEAFEAGLGTQRSVVVFRANDPYWYDTAPTSVTYRTAPASPFLGDPFLPLRLSSDTILGEQTVTNDGDVLAWPVWTVHGPATSVRLTNVTTGLVIDLPVALTATQSVVIDTRPFRKTVRRDDGTNLYGSLTDASALWPLPEGASTVRAELPGATSATYVTLVYARRWLSP